MPSRVSWAKRSLSTEILDVKEGSSIAIVVVVSITSPFSESSSFEDPCRLCMSSDESPIEFTPL